MKRRPAGRGTSGRQPLGPGSPCAQGDRLGPTGQHRHHTGLTRLPNQRWPKSHTPGQPNRPVGLGYYPAGRSARTLQTKSQTLEI